MFPNESASIRAHLAERLIAIGENPSRLEWVHTSFGGEVDEGFVKTLEAQHAAYCAWSPRLFEYEKECRKESPIPSGWKLSAADKAIQSVVNTLIVANTPPSSLPNKLNICVVPLAGMQVLKRHWGGPMSNAILLTSDELRRWHQFHTPDSCSWYATYQWDVEEPKHRNEIRLSENEAINELLDSRSFEFLSAELDEGEVPLIAIAGYSLGPLSGRWTHDLWARNGRKVRFVRQILSAVS